MTAELRLGDARLSPPQPSLHNRHLPWIFRRVFDWLAQGVRASIRYVGRECAPRWHLAVGLSPVTFAHGRPRPWNASPRVARPSTARPGSLVAVPGGAAGDSTPATVPPGLALLVARSQNLHVPSVIATERVGFAGRGETTALVSLSERARTSPLEFALTATTVLGFPYHARYLGGELYWEPPRQLISTVPGLNSQLRGRRWIRLTRRELSTIPGVHRPSPINQFAPNPLLSTGLAPLVAIENNIVRSVPRHPVASQ